MDKLKTKAFAEARIIVRNKILEVKGLDYNELSSEEKAKLNEMVDRKDALIQELADKRYAKSVAALNENFKKTVLSKKKEDKPVDVKAGKPPIEQHNKFEEEVQQESTIYSALVKKSEKSGIALEALGEVYNRGWNCWTEDCKVSQQQYAFARVNSFINRGKTYFNEDADLVESGASLCAEDLNEQFKKGQTVAVTVENPKIQNTPTSGKIHQLNNTHAVLRTVGGTGYYKVPLEHLSADRSDDWLKRKYKKEEVEQVDELSSNTVSNYIEKAISDYSKSENPHRIDGIKTAISKKNSYGVKPAKVMAKEEAEQIDELSKRALARYLVKSAEDMANSQGKGVSLDTSARRQPHSKDKPFLQSKADQQWNKVRKRKEGISVAALKLANEDVKVADKVPVLIPSHQDQYGNTIPAQTVMKKTGRKIIKSGNVHDGRDS